MSASKVREGCSFETPFLCGQCLTWLPGCLCGNSLLSGPIEILVAETISRKGLACTTWQPEVKSPLCPYQLHDHLAFLIFLSYETGP